jgi:hypothetical protein
MRLRCREMIVKTSERGSAALATRVATERAMTETAVLSLRGITAKATNIPPDADQPFGCLRGSPTLCRFFANDTPGPASES